MYRLALVTAYFTAGFALARWIDWSEHGLTKAIVALLAVGCVSVVWSAARMAAVADRQVERGEYMERK